MKSELQKYYKKPAAVVPPKPCPIAAAHKVLARSKQISEAAEAFIASARSLPAPESALEVPKPPEPRNAVLDELTRLTRKRA